MSIYGTGDWPSHWRCVHVTLPSEVVDTLLAADPATRSMVTIDDGDCGDVWGETRQDGCRPHTTVWCHEADVAVVTADLDRAALLVVTDPNVWSEDQVVVHDAIAHACVHSIPRSAR